MSQAFASQLALQVQKANVKVQNINGTTLETNGIIVFNFSLLDKNDRERFFQKSFLLADVKLGIVVGISFLILSNSNFDFQAWNLQSSSYIIVPVLSTTRRVKLIEKTKFTIAASNKEYKTLVIYIIAFS